MSAAKVVRRLLVLSASAGVLASPAAAASPNSWRPAAAMPTAHFASGNAALSGDRVLFAGGEDGQSDELKSASIYNAASNTWTAAADMGIARIAPGAVALPSGKVLVVGGANLATLNNALDSGEVYDPGTGPGTDSWTPTVNNMSTGRGQGPIAVLLANHKVLIAGGTDQNTQPLATADLYDPATNTFAPTGSMGSARWLASATLLSNGKVLVAGGVTAGITASQTADVYDPQTGTWTPVANATSAPRVYAGAALLPNGKVLIAGGQPFGGLSTAATDIYDPATNRFTPGPAMGFPRSGFGLVSLPGGQPLVIGGFYGNLSIAPTAQLFNPSTNTWATVSSPSVPKEAGTAIRLNDGDVLWASGFDGENPLSDAELYTPPVPPGQPTSVSATPGNGSATVAFAAPAADGGLPVLHYTVTASTGQTATTPDARTFATVTGLTNGKPVTFTVTATTGFGTSVASAASRATTPTAPVAPVPPPKLKLSGLKSKLKLSAFLKGVRFIASPDRSASLRVTLVGSVNRATIARAYQLVLATKQLGASAKKRTVTIVPAKKLVGKPRKATVQLVIVATGSNGRQSTNMKQITVTR